MLYLLLFEKKKGKKGRKERKKEGRRKGRKKERKGREKSQGAFSQERFVLLAVPCWDFSGC
jgi:hypothetical protein